jgi:hypothetical protein
MRRRASTTISPLPLNTDLSFGKDGVAAIRPMYYELSAAFLGRTDTIPRCRTTPRLGTPHESSELPLGLGA